MTIIVNSARLFRTAALGERSPGPPFRLLAAVLSACPALLVIAACAQTPPAGAMQLPPEFPHIFAKRGCTQEDAPALEIYLTRVPYRGKGDPAPPYLRFEISLSPREAIAAPVVLELMPLRRDPARAGRIVRAEHVDRQHRSTWLNGAITLDSATPGKTVTGRFDVSAPGGPHWSAAFTAEYSSHPAVCG